MPLTIINSNRFMNELPICIIYHFNHIEIEPQITYDISQINCYSLEMDRKSHITCLLIVFACNYLNIHNYDMIFGTYTLCTDVSKWQTRSTHNNVNCEVCQTERVIVSTQSQKLFFFTQRKYPNDTY